MKKLTLLFPAALLSALLAACSGGIPLPTFSLKDTTITLPTATSATPGVIYQLSSNSFPSAAKLLSSVTLTGTALYTGYGNFSQATLYVRTSLDGCSITQNSSYALCSGDESANSIGTLSVVKGQPGNSFTLGGAALNAALKSDTVYYGVKINDGNTVSGDQLQLTNLQVQSRL